jgi:hypothetical protein
VARGIGYIVAVTTSTTPTPTPTLPKRPPWPGVVLCLLTTAVLSGIAAYQATIPADADELGPARARGVLLGLGGSEGDCLASAPEGSICGSSSLSDDQLAQAFQALLNKNIVPSRDQATIVPVAAENQEFEITATWEYSAWQLVVWPKPHLK